MNIEAIVTAQHDYFSGGETLPVSFRKAALRRLRDAILAREADIHAALHSDLNKSASESYMCEVGMTLSELNYMLSHIDRWAKKRYVVSPLAQFHARSFTVHNPYGVVLIMSPWNYPFMLTMEPLIGALAAGNCCVVKPSAYAPATSAIIREIVSTCFPSDYVIVIEGGRKENQALLDQRFDYIFFTGGVTVGREVMRKATEHLTPVSLELGGKSPCIVDATAKLDLAAKRLAFGKLLNCGQTCVAPDYVLCDERVAGDLVRELEAEIARQFGVAPIGNGDYGKIVNGKHFERLRALMQTGEIAYGGSCEERTLTIEPSVMVNVGWDDPIMQEEIFGPILPIITYSSLDDALEQLADRPKPLAFYLFSSDRATIDYVLSTAQFGGGCVNDTIIHLATSNMRFGGVGASGMGSYHGKAGFETFSHYKSIVDKVTWIDVPMRYQPFKRINDLMIRLCLH